MHRQHQEELEKAFQVVGENLRHLDAAVKDIHDYLSHLKNEKDLDNLTTRVKALEEAYAELLLTGKAND